MLWGISSSVYKFFEVAFVKSIARSTENVKLMNSGQDVGNKN